VNFFIGAFFIRLAAAKGKNTYEIAKKNIFHDHGCRDGRALYNHLHNFPGGLFGAGHRVFED